MKISFDRRLDPTMTVCQDPTREMISGVQLDAKNKRLVSTDGHRLIAIPVEIDGNAVDGKIDPAQLTDARKRAKAADVAGKYMARVRAAEKKRQTPPGPTQAEL